MYAKNETFFSLKSTEPLELTFNSVFSNYQKGYSKPQEFELTELWDIEQTAAFLKVSPKTIYDWMARMILNPSVYRRIGGRKLVFLPDAVKAAVLENDLFTQSPDVRHYDTARRGAQVVRPRSDKMGS